MPVTWVRWRPAVRLAGVSMALTIALVATGIIVAAVYISKQREVVLGDDEPAPATGATA